MAHDVVGVGEVMLRLWVPPGERLEDAPALKISVAGAEANVAMAAARMGRSAAWLSRLPSTPLGRRAAREIAAFGVDVSGVRWSENERMGTYFVELSVPPRPISVIYDRDGSAASRMTVDDVAWDIVEEAAVVHLSGITPALSEGMRELSFEVVKRAPTAAVDVNYRSALWSTDEAREVLTDLCRGADLIIVTEEDARDVFGLTGEPDVLLEALRDVTSGGVVILTRGTEGASWKSDGGSGSVRAFDLEVIDRIGGGDAFAAGALIGFLDGDLQTGVERGQAMATLKLGLYGDQLLVEPGEVDELMRGSGREVSR